MPAYWRSLRPTLATLGTRQKRETVTGRGTDGRGRCPAENAAGRRGAAGARSGPRRPVLAADRSPSAGVPRLLGARRARGERRSDPGAKPARDRTLWRPRLGLRRRRSADRSRDLRAWGADPRDLLR